VIDKSSLLVPESICQTLNAVGVSGFCAKCQKFAMICVISYLWYSFRVTVVFVPASQSISFSAVFYQHHFLTVLSFPLCCGFVLDLETVLPVWAAVKIEIRLV